MNKKDISLYIALSIPVLIVVVLALVIYVPRYTTKKPAYNFIYSRADDRYYPSSSEYSVRQGEITVETIPTPIPAPNERLMAPVASQEPRLFLYDVSANSEKEISLEDAKQLTLDDSTISPDGFTVERGGQGGGVFPFFMDNGDYNSLYLSKGSYNVRLNINSSDFNNSLYNVRFIGWVL